MLCLLRAFQPDLIPEEDKAPGEYISLPIKQTEHPCGIEDVVEFIFDYVSGPPDLCNMP
jgi:hypothetical protein